MILIDRVSRLRSPGREREQRRPFFLIRPRARAREHAVLRCMDGSDLVPAVQARPPRCARRPAPSVRVLIVHGLVASDQPGCASIGYRVIATDKRGADFSLDYGGSSKYPPRWQSSPSCVCRSTALRAQSSSSGSRSRPPSCSSKRRQIESALGSIGEWVGRRNRSLLASRRRVSRVE